MIKSSFLTRHLKNIAPTTTHLKKNELLFSSYNYSLLKRRRSFVPHCHHFSKSIATTEEERVSSTSPPPLSNHNNDHYNNLVVQVTQIKLLKSKDTLQLQFKVRNQGSNSAQDVLMCNSLPAELLRVESPSAEVQGHGSSGKRVISGKKFVTITGIEKVGNYGVRIIFSDNHSTGIYTWNYLFDMCQRKYSIMKAYIHALKEKRKSRYPLSYLKRMKEDGHKPFQAEDREPQQ